MIMKQLSTEDRTQMIEMMGAAHYAMKNLVNTLLVVTKSMTHGEIDGAAIGRDAAISMAEMQRKQAEELRRAGDVVEADAMDKGTDQFQDIIEQMFGPAATKQ